MSTHTPSRQTQEDELVPAEAAELPPTPWLHWVLLGMSLVVLAASFVLQREGPEDVALAGVNFVLPPTCGSRVMWGWDCPGCGLTRSFVSLAHGDLLASLAVNPAGLFLFGFVVLQLPYRIAQLYRIRRGLGQWNLIQPAIWFWGFLILVLMGQWLARLPVW